MMKIEGILWLEEIVEKLLLKHGVLRHEVKEIMESKPKFRFVEKGHRKNENVYLAMGKTEVGRYLIIFFVYKQGNQALILSARDMSSSERRKYEQK